MRKAMLMVLSVIVSGSVYGAQEFTSGFEEGAPPAGWTIADGGMSTVSGDRSRSGERSLRIEDADEAAGSSARSVALAAEPGQVALVSLWAYLEAGDATGLGVYMHFTDADGRRLNEESERSLRRPQMREGQWTQFTYAHTVPEGVAAVGLWLHTFSVARVTCFVDDVTLRVLAPEEVGPGLEWSGGLLQDEVRQVWPYAVRWAHGESTSLTWSFDEPRDWSEWGAVRFLFHSPAATGATFMALIFSENEESEGIDYYSFRVTVDWEGWREFVLPFHELGRAREPVGWHKIDRVQFTAAGWNQTPDPETVVVLDGFELLPPGEAGRLPSDEEFFATLDLDLPALAGVRRAVEAGDMAAARQALADHLRSRTYPRWYFDWRDRPLRDAQVPGPEDDKAPDQWDYYSMFITVDWEGWKQFTLRKEDFSPRALVEGEGWQGKQPIGWHWIQYIALNARGWGLTPDPATVLYFDDIRLVGQDKEYLISDFGGETSDWEGLELSTEQARSGGVSGKWANQLQTGGIRCRQIPHDWTDYDALDFWVYSEKATGSRLVIVLDSDVPRVVEAAEKALRREFDYTMGPGQRGTLQFGEQIDWTANPTEGEARTHLWNESLNRHFHFRNLARAYWDAGRDEYAAEIAAQIVDWAERMPRPLLSSGNSVGHYAWQTLTTGIRLADTWPEAYYRCLDSPAFTPEVLTAMLKAVREQCLHLVRWPSGGNWLTAESNGLFTAGMLFPEFKEAAEWRRIALDRLYRQLETDIYPDGMQFELAIGYNNWVVTQFARILELCDLNDLRGELPADWLPRMESMFNYLLFASMPNGEVPGLNDSGNSNVRGLLNTGFELFPQREDFLFGATAGARGAEPDETSYALPWTGHYVMRSGWGADASYLLFDAGPFGYGHQHEDKLHFVLWAQGRQHVLDPGNFSYDRSRWRRYVLSTRAHNTVMVDGLDQNRRRKPETRIRPYPWEGDAPPDNDARWATAPEYDFAFGVYDDGYGPEGAVDVVHKRRILHLKKHGLFVVLDSMQPAGEAEHRYEALFHLDSEEAEIIERGAVTTLNEGESNLVIIPAGPMDVEIVKGRSEEPVQGWANGPWRAIPTAIYSTTGAGNARMAFVLEPVAAGGEASVVAVTALPDIEDGAALELTLADGTRLLIIQRDAPGPAREIAGVAVEREMTVATAAPGEAPVVRFAFDGEAP